MSVPSISQLPYCIYSPPELEACGSTYCSNGGECVNGTSCHCAKGFGGENCDLAFCECHNYHAFGIIFPVLYGGLTNNVNAVTAHIVLSVMFSQVTLSATTMEGASTDTATAPLGMVDCTVRKVCILGVIRLYICLISGGFRRWLSAFGLAVCMPAHLHPPHLLPTELAPCGNGYCHNGGHCIAEGTCVCQNTFVGQFCEQEICELLSTLSRCSSLSIPITE